ncbi:GntR family transcriptional regulator [Ignavigranum ruoffiae]|uniref:GntR family transcriptional regulator n=1 Tax=Ignavigranum ruoffiae TaxID=89093 RepID=UPI0024AD2F01|nr:GntR family transcriptional regulator [Ignavigranum ruoffiae]
MNKASLYLQLKNELIHMIHSELEPGGYLPSERKIAELYHLSRTTVRLALKELESFGYIDIIHGKGSLVLDPAHQKINLTNLYSFTENMRLLGKEPSNQILVFKRIEASVEVSSKLQLNLADPVVYFKRLRLADQNPMLLEETYLPDHIFSDLTQKDLEDHSLYQLMKDRYQIFIQNAKEEFQAAMIENKAAKYLQVPDKDPALIILRQTFDNNNRVIEYTKSTARADKFVFKTVHINRM